MAYVKNTWIDQKVQRPKTYNFTTNDDGSTTLIDAFGNVEELGTPVNADNMNHIEDGLSTVGMWAYSKTVEYNKDDAVISVVEDKFVLYKSKQNNNKGNALDNKEFWEEVSLGGGGNAGLSLFDLVEKDHILTYEESNGLAQLGTYVYKTAVAGSRYGYPTFYNQCVKEMQAGTPTQTQLGGNTVTLYKNDNGHIFYDISSKDTIDTWYNTYGVAWYYGVDTVNKRIFLPYPDKTVLNRKLVKQIRNDNAGYDLYADGWKKEWGRHTAGTGVGSFPFSIPFANTNYMAQLSSISGTNQTASNSNRGGLINLSTTSMAIQQAEGTYVYSWIAEGQTNVITDVKANKYFYMCVGNTDVERAITDVVDITTSENDTIPLGWSTYQSVGTPSSAFLASLGQQNSGTLYSSFYNEFSAKIGQKFGVGTIKEAHTVYDPSKFTVVGNPTITSDGIASGFSASNYISLDTAILDTSRPWNISFNFNCNKYDKIQGLIKLDRETSVCVMVRPSGEIFFRNHFVDLNTDLKSKPNLIQLNTDYICDIGWTGTMYYLKINNNLISSRGSTEVTLSRETFLGVGQEGYYSTTSSIDLKAFSITVDGEEVFKGTKTVMPDDVTDYDLVINQDDQTFRLPLKNGSELIADNSNDKITSQLFNSTHPYTATERVFVTGNFYSTGGTASEAFINGVRIASEASGYGSFQVILNKGDVLTTTAVATDKWAQINIAPVVGNGTLYYKVSNAVQNLQLMDVAEVTTALANKVDTSNTQWATNACMPDYSAGISVTYPLSSNPYTAPCNGMLCSWGKPSNTPIRPIINGVKQEYLRLGELSGGSGGYQGRSIYLSKGDVMYFNESYSVLNGCTFYPLKGAK